MNKWKDITSAPKDGTLILAHSPKWDAPQLIRWIFNTRHKEHGWNDRVELDEHDDLNFADPPIYWIPIPRLTKDAES